VGQEQLPEAAAKATPQAVSMAQQELAPLGDARLIYLGKSAGGSTTTYDYRVIFKAVTALMHFEVDGNGKVDPILSLL
jgi:hypothetical protein